MHRSRRAIVASLLLAAGAIGLASSSPLSAEQIRASRLGADRGARPLDDEAQKNPGPGNRTSTVDASGIAGGYVFVPINPYRAFDSRDYSDGYTLGGDEWVLDIGAGVNIPTDAVAVTYNLAVTDTSGGGFLAVYPADITWPGNASINWSYDGTTLSNGGTVAIGFYDAPGQLAVYCGPALLTTGTDFVIDITGFYV